MDTSEIMTEKEIISSWQQGNDRCYNWLFNKYYHVNVRFVYSLTRDRMVSEEIAMDVMTIIWQRKMFIKTDIPIVRLMLKTAKNKVIDSRRRQKLKLVDVDDIARASETYVRFIDDTVLQNEVDKTYMNGLRMLPPKRRLAFCLNRELGMPYADIAKHMNLSVNTVENHIALALKDFRNYFDKLRLHDHIFGRHR